VALAVWRVGQCVVCYSLQLWVGEAASLGNQVGGGPTAVVEFQAHAGQGQLCFPLALKYQARTDANKGNPTV